MGRDTWSRAGELAWMLRSAKTEVPVSPGSIALARAFVDRTLHDWHHEDRDSVVALLTSELVTNAICHSAHPVMVGLCLDEGMLRVEASDDDPALPRVLTSDPLRESGRGMYLIDSLASRWGTERCGPSKVVWFEAPVSPTPGWSP